MGRLLVGPGYASLVSVQKFRRVGRLRRSKRGLNRRFVPACVSSQNLFQFTPMDRIRPVSIH